jgi:hypothetical protein
VNRERWVMKTRTILSGVQRLQGLLAVAAAIALINGCASERREGESIAALPQALEPVRQS